MKKFFSAFLAVLITVFLTSCPKNDFSDVETEDYQQSDKNASSYYKDDEEEDTGEEEDPENAQWDVNFTFSGTINDGNAENINLGSGILTYINIANETITVNSATWAIKKTITLNSGHQVPMIQIFFADNSSNVDEEGRFIYFILQLEGSSVSSKSETYYLNNDKLYKARVKIDPETEGIDEICYIQEPDPSKGKVNIFTHNIRIGEELRVSGYANMKDMEIKECKKMN